MHYKYILWITMLFLSLTSVVLPRDLGRGIQIKKWVISENSSLSVNGSTNINKFSCEIAAYDQTDTLTVNENKANNGIVLSGKISLNIKSFDCHNSGMTKQLQKTLKQQQFPVLHIIFLSLNKVPELTQRPEFIKGLVDIEIAGIRKRFEINYQITQGAQKVIYIVGSRDINFSDFDLVPPKKLGGMIKTKDQLNVTFNLKIKTLE